MKIKLTHPVGEMQAGLVYDLPASDAREIIRQDLGYAVEDEQTTQRKTKRTVTNDAGQNDT